MSTEKHRDPFVLRGRCSKRLVGLEPDVLWYPVGDGLFGKQASDEFAVTDLYEECGRMHETKNVKRKE